MLSAEPDALHLLRLPERVTRSLTARLLLRSMRNKGPAVTVDVIYFSLGHLRWGTSND